MNITSNKKLRKFPIFFVAILGFLPSTSFAQSLTNPAAKSGSENSPYNRFGMGMLSPVPNTVLRGFGGSNAAFTDELQINTDNPASYTFLKTTTLDFAVETKSRSVAFENVPGKNSITGSISYLNISFPIPKFGGFTLGFNPVSNKYHYLSDSTMVGLDTAVRIFGGSGGLQKAFAGISGGYKGFSLGFNFGYTFGNIRQFRSLTPVGISMFRVYELNDRTNYGGLNWNVGAIYKHKFSNNNFVGIGATYQPSQKLKGNKNLSEIVTTMINSSQTNSNQIVNIDTLSNLQDQKGTWQLPSQLSLGLHYGKTSVYDAMVDFTYYDWKDYSNYGLKDSIANTSWKISGGFGYTPDYTALNRTNGKYFSAVTYRFGAYYINDYVSLKNTQLKDIGASVGFSFPFKRNTSNNQYGQVNTSLNFGRRGTLDNGLARENYFRLTIGASLNDIWFIKPKYD